MEQKPLFANSVRYILPFLVKILYLISFFCLRNVFLLVIILNLVIVRLEGPFKNCFSHTRDIIRWYFCLVQMKDFSDEEVIEWEKGGPTSYPVAVQRWNPTTLVVSSRVELIIAADRQDQTAALKEKISEHFQVPMSKIALSGVNYLRN